MATISCHSNQSSYPIGTKKQNNIIRSPYLYMWNMIRIGFMSSEISFENVDNNDGQQMSAYTISSPMSLQLRWAKKLTTYGITASYTRGPPDYWSLYIL